MLTAGGKRRKKYENRKLNFDILQNTTTANTIIIMTTTAMATEIQAGLGRANYRGIFIIINI